MGVHELSAVALQLLLSVGADLELPEAQARVLVAAVGDVLVGGRGELSLTLLETPAVGFPLVVAVGESPFSLRDHRLSWADVVDPLARQPRLSAPFVAPAESGTYTLRALVSYVVCDAQRCRPRRARVRWEVEVLPVDPPRASP